MIHSRIQDPRFRWRGREVSRVEGFSDAVFAFAVTLLIVSLEVPHSFEGLLGALRGFPAFVVCFALLMTFWNAHYRFFRRYGIEDGFTRFITIGILLLVLFYVYPLKFLFASILQFGPHAEAPIKTWEELQFIYLIYGLGFAGIWSLYAMLYIRVLKFKQQLALNVSEYWETRSELSGFVINIIVCLVSILSSRLVVNASLPGFTYMILMLALPLNTRWHRRQAKIALKR